MKKFNTTPATQKAFDYSLYMVAESFFAHTSCKTPSQEAKLRIHFYELSENKQAELLGVCDKLFADFEKKIPTEYFSQPVDIHLVARKDGSATDAYFVGDSFTLRFLGDFKGGNTKVKCQFLK